MHLKNYKKMEILQRKNPVRKHENPIYLSKEKKELFTKFLTTRDYEKVAEASGYSFSSVNNILNGRTQITADNMTVVSEFNRICLERVRDTKSYISEVEAKRLLEVI